MERIQALDFARGLVIVLMVVFHYSVTISFFGDISRSDFIYWFAYPRMLASIFIFLSGIAAYISYSNHDKGFEKRYFNRGLNLLKFALLITLFTYIISPERTVYFGVLHFFAASSFIVPFLVKLLIRRSTLNLVLGISILFFGVYLQTVQFGFYQLFWLGMVPEGFVSFDYFPLIPWVGILMMGMYFGKNIMGKPLVSDELRGIAPRVFTFLGRNSLTVYLAHQPVLVAALMLLGFKLAG